MDSKPTKASIVHGKIASWRWGVIWLMFLATLINYMDRQTLMSTAKYIKDEFRLGEEGYGWIEFWFGLSYGLMQFPAGYLADRLNLRWLYVFALVLWSGDFHTVRPWHALTPVRLAGTAFNLSQVVAFVIALTLTILLFLFMRTSQEQDH